MYMISLMVSTTQQGTLGSVICDFTSAMLAKLARTYFCLIYHAWS